MSKPAFRKQAVAALLQHGLARNRAEAIQAVDIVISELVRMAVHEGRAEVRGLGTFRRVNYEPRGYHNPKNMHPVGVQRRWSVRFRPGLGLKGVVE